MAFSGCQLPFFCSTAAQCEAAAAAVVDLGALVLCKAAAPLVVETQNRCYQPDRRRQLLTEGICVDKYCIALQAYVTFLSVSSHKNMCVFLSVCAMLEKTLWHFDICAQAVCVWPFFHIYETACLICKCQRRASGRSEDVFCCVTIKDTHNWQAGSKHMRGNKPWILSGSNTGCLCLWSGFEDSECSRYLPVSDVEICKIFLLVRCFAAKYYICELTQHWLLKI